MSPRALFAGVAVAIAVSAAAPSLARAADSYDMAKSQAAAARQAMTQGQWDEAQARLARVLKRCEPEAQGRPCRLLLHYSLGYLYARWAAASPERRDGLLARSADFYRRVLAEAPDHAETVNNLALVLRDLWRVDELVDLRDRLMARDPALAARIAVVIGDGHAARGEWQTAYRAYAGAVKLDPASEVPRQKLIEAYRQSGGGEVADLLARLRGWEARFPDLAAAGYRAILHADAARDGTLNERALLRWVALTAEQRAISAAFVASQFAGLRLAPLEELVGFLETIERIPPERAPRILDGLNDYSGSRCVGAGHWWLESPYRRNALAQAALALGRAAVVARDAERAEASFVIGALCGPPSEEYMFGALRDEPFVFLDMMTELAWLQFRYPARDPNRAKLDAVVQQLFEGKGEAYQANDLGAIERHHVVLGQIYAEMGVWSGSGARNALFQLSRAVGVAEQRARAGEAYDPMPGIKTLLGEGYERVGDEAAAQATYIAAAQAYLDSDDLVRTEAVLARAKTLAPPSDAAASQRLREIEATEQILSTRRDLERREEAINKSAPPPTTKLAPSPIEAAPAATWLPEDAIEGVSTEFLRRQQFKVNADLAAQAKRENDQTGSERYAREAIRSAREVETLIGADDVRRLEQAGAIAKPEPDGARPRVELSRGGDAANNTADAKRSSWKLRLPSTSEPLEVELKE